MHNMVEAVRSVNEGSGSNFFLFIDRRHRSPHLNQVNVFDVALDQLTVTRGYWFFASVGSFETLA
jgi:hypothetical protein